ncbi:MAG: hypothetical protein ACR2OI_00385 [Acidimicrobiia bacterium]
MTNRLDEEIRSTLGSMIAEAPEPMELDELAMQAAIATVPRQRRSPVPAIAAAFAAMVAVVGAIALLAPSSGESAGPVTTTPATPDVGAWSRIPHDEAVFGAVSGQAVMNGVTAGGPGLVAVGATGPEAAVWTSVDGLAWSRVPHNEAVLGGDSDPICGGAAMMSVAAGGPGLVAVGFDRSLYTGNSDAAVWTSADGITWSRVAHDETTFGGESDSACYGPSMSSVTAGGPGLVAVGWDGQSAAVWTSPDGIAWSRVPHDESIFGGAVGAATMNGVTLGGPGLVAVGSDGLDAAVWTSVDGITWSRVPHDEAMFGYVGVYAYDDDRTQTRAMSSVTGGGPGLVAVGSVGGDDWLGGLMAVWTSVDGITWSRVPHDERVFGSLASYEINDVTATDSGLVAVGSRNGDTHGSAVVWTSPDGITWSQHPHAETAFGGPGDQTIMSVTSTGSGLVAVGSDTGGSVGTDAAVWAGPQND